jgi:hypothetical protein
MNNQKLTSIFLLTGILFFATLTFVCLKVSFSEKVISNLQSKRKPQHNIELDQMLYFIKNDYYNPNARMKMDQSANVDTIRQRQNIDSKAIKVRKQLINCKSGIEYFSPHNFYNTIEDLRLFDNNSSNPRFNSMNSGIETTFIPDEEANSDFELILTFDDGKTIKFPKFNLFKELNLESKYDTNKELGQLKFISPDKKLIFYLIFIIN